MHKTTIQTKHFYMILSDTGSSKLLIQDKSEFHRVLKELTDSGFDDETLHTIITQGGVMSTVLKGCLPKMMVKLRRDHHPTK